MHSSVAMLKKIDDEQWLGSVRPITRDYSNKPPSTWYIVSCSICETTCDFIAMALVDGNIDKDSEMGNVDMQKQETQAEAYCPCCWQADYIKKKKANQYWLRIIYVLIPKRA